MLQPRIMQEKTKMIMNMSMWLRPEEVDTHVCPIVQGICRCVIGYVKATIRLN